jgi:hypothetical protein
MAFHEDDLRSGKAVSTRVARVDGKPMGVAGLWELDGDTDLGRLNDKHDGRW